MLKLTVRHLLEKKIRYGLTMVLVVLGVMFVVSSFVLTDSLRATFSDLAEDITEGTDLTIRVKQEFGSDFTRPTVPDSLVDTVAAVDGVNEVHPGVAALNVVIIDGEGEPILPLGPPALGFNFSPNQFFIIDGRVPASGDEFAVDATTADDNDLVVGETYDINGPVNSQPFELVGLFNFGSPDTNNSVGQTMSAFDLDTAQSFLGFEDEVLEIGVLVAPGANIATVAEALRDAVGDSYEVITQEVAAAEQQDDFNEAITIFATILLVFAFISVFVSAFIINNTFQILLGQRVRELGMWRAIGATPRQVMGSVLGQSAILGALSTAIGIGLGVLLSLGLRWLLTQLGFGLPSGPLSLRPFTVILAVIVGLGVTLVSSLGPAIRAQRISPMAALAVTQSLTETGLRRRLVTGAVVTAVGLVCLGVGMFTGAGGTASTLMLLGLGALLTFVGINILSPAFARPVAGLLGRPLVKAMRLPGRLARDNAVRHPRRTASTAGALMIGLALVGLTTVVGASLEKTFLRILDDAVEADYFVRPTQAGFNPNAGFPAVVADELDALDEIDSVVRYRWGPGAVQVNGSTKDVFVAELDKVGDHMDGDVVLGSLSAGDPRRSVALHVDPAGDLGVGPGDTLEMAFPDGETETLTVNAVYADSALFGNWLIDAELWDAHFSRDDLIFASLTISGMSDDLSDADRSALLASSRTAIDTVLDGYPTVNAENRAEFQEAQQEQINSFLLVINVFLGLSLGMALLGIYNTLALSVFERTHEIGLLRAVGMSRRQMRRSIRWEAIIVATFGGLLGVVVGTVFGVAATIAIPDTFVDDVAIPVVTLLVYVILAGVAGLVAAIFPARRAGRMNILNAIAHL